MTYPYKYAKVGPPFNFLGHMCKTQKKTFYSWIAANLPKQPQVMQWYQIRANQLRKSAGLLEAYYATEYPDPDPSSSHSPTFAPTFEKAPWKPGPNGHFTYVNGNDQLTSINVSQIKEYFRYMLQRDYEGMFWMNWLRNHIERHEDMANLHYEATDRLPILQDELDAMFKAPENENVLVDDTLTKVVTANGISIPGPYSRVSPLDPPLTYELSQLQYDINPNGTVAPGTPQPSSV